MTVQKSETPIQTTDLRDGNWWPNVIKFLARLESQPNSKIKDLCSDGAAEIDRLQDAAENVVIAFGMGWDMDGVIEELRSAINNG